MKQKFLKLPAAALAAVLLRLTDLIGLAASKCIPPRVVRIPGSPRPGISVIIPERENPAMLRECLESVFEAARRLAEPFEVIVVVNGSPKAAYEELCELYPAVKWIFFRKPLWFSGAVREGLKAAKNEWVYLLNSDMTLDALALAELIPWRAPHVFAIASQINFQDPSRRREETGWTKFRESDGFPEIYDAVPEDDCIRGTFYAGGGASLFQKALLRRFSAGSQVYNPFYWEDVEWGTIAWKCGFESLFCPKSRARHYHRATNRLFFSDPEINRIFERNRIQYELRNHLLGTRDRRHLFNYAFREMIRPSIAAGILWSRLKHWTYPYREFPLQFSWRSYYMKPWTVATEQRAILIVTPYAIYPPAHGGAMRLQKLIQLISPFFTIVLVTDEADEYTPSALNYFEPLSSIHMVAGRPDGIGVGMIERIRSHSHPALKTALRMLAVSRDPALVQIEFTELAGLIEARRNSVPWLLTLHEVWLSDRSESISSDERDESALVQKFDAIIACSEEDAQLIHHRSVHIVPNGADTYAKPYTPSPESGPLLFIGPFRYGPNLLGIRKFLEDVYPRLLKSVPNLRLWVLGGHCANQTASQIRCFSQKGVTVMDYIEHVRPILDQCSITINPLQGVRGSCLKIVESLAAGRACVSTKEGARGFLDCGSRALVVVETIAEFEAHIMQLFCDLSFRRSCEQPSSEILREHSWDAGAQKLISIYGRLIGMDTDLKPGTAVGGLRAATRQ